jgi:hypothetical protein
MRCALVGCLLVVGCASRHAPAPPAASSDWRCAVRITERGILVDGAPMSRVEAIARCKHAPGGAVVVIEHGSETRWDPVLDALVSIKSTTTQTVWAELRAELAHEGVRVYVRGPLCYELDPLGCRPRLPPERAPAPPKPQALPPEPLPPR